MNPDPLVSFAILQAHPGTPDPVLRLLSFPKALKLAPLRIVLYEGSEILHHILGLDLYLLIVYEYLEAPIWSSLMHCLTECLTRDVHDGFHCTWFERDRRQLDKDWREWRLSNRLAHLLCGVQIHLPTVTATAMEATMKMERCHSQTYRQFTIPKGSRSWTLRQSHNAGTRP